jgi:hypothetical protein
MRGTWQTTDDGGGGLGAAVLVLLGVAAVAAVAGPVVAAVAELVPVILIVAGVILGLRAVGLVALLAFRVRRRLVGAARVTLPNPGAESPLPRVARAAQPLPKPQRRALPPEAGQLHLHFHGVSAEDAAAIRERHRLDG